MIVEYATMCGMSPPGHGGLATSQTRTTTFTGDGNPSKRAPAPFVCSSVEPNKVIQMALSDSAQSCVNLKGPVPQGWRKGGGAIGWPGSEVWCHALNGPTTPAGGGVGGGRGPTTHAGGGVAGGRGPAPPAGGGVAGGRGPATPAGGGVSGGRGPTAPTDDIDGPTHVPTSPRGRATFGGIPGRPPDLLRGGARGPAVEDPLGGGGPGGPNGVRSPAGWPTCPPKGEGATQLRWAVSCPANSVVPARATGASI